MKKYLRDYNKTVDFSFNMIYNIYREINKTSKDLEVFNDLQ